MSHPDHKRHISSLKRIEGQVSGIIKMIENKKYCIDILNQVKAVKNSISSVERKLSLSKINLIEIPNHSLELLTEIIYFLSIFHWKNRF